jgi:hypothetical protein
MFRPLASDKGSMRLCVMHFDIMQAALSFQIELESRDKQKGSLEVWPSSNLFSCQKIRL